MSLRLPPVGEHSLSSSIGKQIFKGGLKTLVLGSAIILGCEKAKESVTNPQLPHQ